MAKFEDTEMQRLIALIEKRAALRSRPADSILDLVRLENRITEQAAAVLRCGCFAATRTIRELASAHQTG